jgi:hypothetical protein
MTKAVETAGRRRLGYSRGRTAGPRWPGRSRSDHRLADHPPSYPRSPRTTSSPSCRPEERVRGGGHIAPAASPCGYEWRSTSPAGACASSSATTTTTLSSASARPPESTPGYRTGSAAPAPSPRRSSASPDTRGNGSTPGPSHGSRRQPASASAAASSSDARPACSARPGSSRSHAAARRMRVWSARPRSMPFYSPAVGMGPSGRGVRAARGKPSSTRMSYSFALGRQRASRLGEASPLSTSCNDQLPAGDV